MAANQYKKGELIRLSFVCVDANGQAQDPSTLTIKTKDPVGEILAYVWQTDAEVIRDSPGHFHLLLDASAHGTWHYGAFTTGTGQSANWKTILVLASPFDTN